MCCRSPSEWRVEVELSKQIVPILILLLLVLLDVGEAISYFCLPLGVLVKHILDVLLCLFNICQPGVEAGVLHLLVMIAHWLIMIATGREGHTSSLVAA